MPKGFDFAIKSFPDDDRLWRLMWFGQLLWNPKVPSELLLEVVLVPYVGKDFSGASLRLSKNYFQPDATVRHIGIGHLLPITIGSFWRGKRPASFENQFENPFESRDVPEVVQVFPGVAMNGPGCRITDPQSEQFRLLNGTNYPAQRFCSRAKLFCIPMPPRDGQQPSGGLILIPCVEVFRFYYANSTQLTLELISGGLDIGANTVYDPTLTIDNPEGYSKVRLRQRILDEDAFIVGRIALSPFAQRAARSIFGSIAKNSAAGGSVLEARPPFEGMTDLTVSGQWITLQEPGQRQGEPKKEPWHFFVHRILSCSGEFPYSHLLFSRDNDGRVRPGPDERPEIGRKVLEKKKQPEDLPNDPPITTDSEPTLSMEAIEAFVGTVRFPDLKGKDIQKEEKDTAQYSSAKVRPVEPVAGEDLGTGDGTAKKVPTMPLTITRKKAAVGMLPNRPPEEGETVVAQEGEAGLEQEGQDEPMTEEREQARLKPMPGSPQLFFYVMEELKKKEGIECIPIRLEVEGEWASGSPYTSYFPTILKRKRTNWAYLDDQRKRRRQVMIALVQYRHRYFYILDGEKKRDEPSDCFAWLVLNRKDNSKISDECLKEVLIACTHSRGGWLAGDKLGLLGFLEHREFWHNLLKPEDYAARFLQYFSASPEYF
jgi:hypothetical protein